MLQDKDVSQDPAHVMSLGVLQPKNSEPLLFLSSSQISGFGCFPWLLSSDCFSKKPITSHVSLQIASVCKNNRKVQTEAGEGSIQRAVHLRWVKNKVGGKKKWFFTIRCLQYHEVRIHHQFLCCSGSAGVSLSWSYFELSFQVPLQYLTAVLNEDYPIKVTFLPDFSYCLLLCRLR